MENDRTRQALDVILDVFCERHPRGFAALVEITREDFWFRDPFVELHGLKAYKNLLREGAKYRRKTQWLVSGSAVQGTRGYVRWLYKAEYVDGTHCEFDGMTEFGFDDEGRLAFQIDFWDSADAFVGRNAELSAAIAEAKNGLHL